MNGNYANYTAYHLILYTCSIEYTIVLYNALAYQEVRGHSMFLSPSDTTSRLSCLWRFVLEGYILDSIFLILHFKHY